jgi:hypothetical protein
MFKLIQSQNKYYSNGQQLTKLPIWQFNFVTGTKKTTITVALFACVYSPPPWLTCHLRLTYQSLLCPALPACKAGGLGLRSFFGRQRDWPPYHYCHCYNFYCSCVLSIVHGISSYSYGFLHTTSRPHQAAKHVLM